MIESFPITIEGYDEMEKELKHRKSNLRIEISKEISIARDHGDLKENAEYHAAREKQSFNEGRISELEDKIARSEVIDVSKFKDSKNIKFGAYVKIQDEDENILEYRIVSDYESDINKGFISVNSPIARALIGKTVSDIIDVSTPKGNKEYEILSLRY